MDDTTFLGLARHACLENRTAAPLLVFYEAMDTPDSMSVVAGVDPLGHADGTSSAIAQALVGCARTHLALATRTSWAPDPQDELREAWMLVAVSAERGAIYLIRHLDADGPWHEIPPANAPEFAVATAAGLDGCLRGEPFRTLRYGHGPELDDMERDLQADR